MVELVELAELEELEGEKERDRTVGRKTVEAGVTGLNGSMNIGEEGNGRHEIRGKN